MQEWNQDWRLLESSGWVLVRTGVEILDFDFSSLLQGIWRPGKFFSVSQSFSFSESAEFYWCLPQQSLSLWNSRIRRYHTDKKKREKIRALQIKESHHSYFKVIVLTRKEEFKTFFHQIQDSESASVNIWFILIFYYLILLHFLLLNSIITGTLIIAS